MSMTKIEKQRLDLPSHLKQAKKQNKTTPTSKPHNMLVFKTLDSRQQRTVIPERWETLPVTQLTLGFSWWEEGANKVEPSRLTQLRR